MHLFTAFQDAALKWPDQVCMRVRTEGQVLSFTYHEIFNDVVNVGQWLNENGLKEKEKVALVLENCPQWAVAYFGIISAGLTVVPIDVQSAYPDLQYILKETQSRVAIVSPSIKFIDKLGALAFLEKIVIAGDVPASGKIIPYSQILSQKFPADFNPKLHDEDLASIIYTSGTTATPKGVMLTHKNFWANFSSIQKLNVVCEKDTFLSILPLHHAYSFMVTLLTPLYSGCKIVYLDSLRADQIFKSLQEEKITIFVVVPELLNLFSKKIKERLPGIVLNLLLNFSGIVRTILRFNLGAVFFSKVHAVFGNLRLFICGGAKMDVEVGKFFYNLGFNVLEGYGLTETSPVVTLNPLQKPKIGSVGKPLPGITIKIVNLEPEGIGEVLIKGDNVMKGYFQNPDDTRAVLKDGWFYTGDLGSLDEEGYLSIEGRIKEIIVLSNGKNISPEEIEGHYLNNPFIKEICVLADEKTDRLVAVAVANMDFFKAQGETRVFPTIKWRMEHLSQELPSYKRLRDFVLVHHDLPRTRLGKLKRFEVARIYKDQSLQKPISQEEIEPKELGIFEKKVIGILKKAKPGQDIFLSTHMEMDLGIDSLEMLELMAAVEKAFNVKINEGDFAKVFTVKELVEKIEGLVLEGGEAFTHKEALAWDEILNQPPSENLSRNIDLTPGLGSKIFTIWWAGFYYLVFRVFFNLKVYGPKNLGEGKVLLCPNHASFLDSLAIVSSVPLNFKFNLFFLGLNKYFENPVLKPLLKYLRVIPVDYAANVIESFKCASLVLRHQKALCVFPEGSRSVEGPIKEFKKGIGILAKELDVPIIPVYIDGTHKAWSPNQKFPKLFVPVKVVFGQALSYKELIQKGLAINNSVDDYQAISLATHAEVIKLKHELAQMTK